MQIFKSVVRLMLAVPGLKPVARGLLRTVGRLTPRSWSMPVVVRLNHRLAGDHPVKVGWHGVQAWINPRQFIGMNVYYFGQWEPKILACMERYLNPDHIFVDVGANIGLFTLQAARMLRDGKVIAFEPYPPALESLRQNVDLNGFKNVSIEPIALSDCKGNITLYTAPDATNQGLSSLIPGERCNIPTQVATLPFDEYVDRNPGLEVDLMKIDVEGAEVQVILGMRRVLSSNHPPTLLIELHDTLEPVMAALAEHHYRIDAIANDGRPIPLDRVDTDQLDYVICRPTVKS